MARLHSLLLVEEKLLEAQYFARRLEFLTTDHFQYEFNAFLSSARSVTSFIQKEMAHVDGFGDWWPSQQTKMREDPSMRFFWDLRNFSQKEGRILMVGAPRPIASKREAWTYRFVGNDSPVPSALLHRDVVDCRIEHLSKLARVTLACADAFPFHSCPRRAVTPGGLVALGLELRDIERLVGLPLGFTAKSTLPRAQVFRVLQKHFDAVDFEAIMEIATYPPQSPATPVTPSDRLTDRLLRSSVNRLARRPTEP